VTEERDSDFPQARLEKVDTDAMRLSAHAHENRPRDAADNERAKRLAGLLIEFRTM